MVGCRGNRKVSKMLSWGAALLLLVAPPAILPHLSDARAADAATAPASLDENLQKLFAGANPMGLADLKAMQSHVQTLTAQLNKVTVGVQVGPAQGSGVIISKDGYVL